MTWAGLWRPPVGEQIPAEWVWTVVDALDELYFRHQELEQYVQQQFDCIEKKLDTANLYLYRIYTIVREVKQDTAEIKQGISISNEYLRLIAPGKGIITLVKTVTPTPSPLYVDELTVRRILIKIPTDALYLIYIGNKESQDFILEKGEKLELNVTKPSQVYVRSTGEQKIFLLFELAQ